MPDYEVLIDAGQAGIQREFDYSEAVAGADLGNAFYTGAIVGEVDGVLRWTLTWKKVHRDKTVLQARTYNFVDIGSPMKRAQYLEEFVHRRIQGGNDPFWFRDVNHPILEMRRLTLCRLMEPVKLIQTQDSSDSYLWSYGLKFQMQRGAPDQD